MSDDLKHWSKLLQAIAKGVVIPIVGRDLLRIEVDGREQLLYEYLAAQLAAQLEVECEPYASIDQVVAAYLNASRRNSRDDVNLKAFEILTQIGAAEGHLPVPEPLRKLGARTGCLGLFDETESLPIFRVLEYSECRWRIGSVLMFH